MAAGWPAPRCGAPLLLCAAAPAGCGAGHSGRWIQVRPEGSNDAAHERVRPHRQTRQLTGV